jgi:BirA family biotin operon repressor/biotin-[acetyl-CoA-carboxylase] ligase
MWAIRSFETLPSTQTYVIEGIRDGTIRSPLVVIARDQTQGRGSRSNTWEGGEGNLFASIAVEASAMPEDLLPQSASIYFAWLMREVLVEIDEKVWLKWPNDLYLGQEKIGGVITHKLKNFFVVGIGVNLKKNKNNYSALCTDIPALILLNIFLQRLDKYPKWKHLFSKYQIEFEQNSAFSAHSNDAIISLRDALLLEDGSLQINDERIYSLR